MCGCLCIGHRSFYFEGSHYSIAKKLLIFHRASSSHPKPSHFVSFFWSDFSYSHNFIVNADGASKGNPRTVVGVVIICTSQEEFIDEFSMFLGTFSSNGVGDFFVAEIGGYAGPLVFSYSNRLYHSCFMYY